MSRAIDAYPLLWKVYAIVLLALFVSSCWAFVIGYATRYRWWDNQVGRHLISFSGCLGLFGTYYTVLAVWPDMPGRSGIRLALFTVLTGVTVWRFFWFMHIRAEERRKDGAVHGSANAPNQEV